MEKNMEAELFKTIAHVAPPEQIPAGKWLTTLNALLKRDMQGGMDWLSQCKQALIKWSDRPQMEGTVAAPAKPGCTCCLRTASARAA